MQFEEITSAPDPEIRFLTCLIPLFNKAYKEFIKIKKHNNILSDILSDETLVNMIKKDLIHLLLPLINRVCIYEMHNLSVAGKLKGSTSEARFQHFISLLEVKRNVKSLLKKYPVMMGLIKTIFKQYIQVRKELFDHLQTDYTDICATLFDSQDKLWEVCGIESNGDMHQQGRSVCILFFKNGKEQKKIVYKPRSLLIDVAYQELINWFNNYFEEEYHLICPRVLAKDNYGWCGFIESIPCRTEKDLCLFYKRIGMLLCISYFLGSNDLHAENIIAHGAYPIIVDHECMLRPVIKNDDNMNSFSRHFVLNTFLLPCQYFARTDYSGIDMSGIAGGQGGQEAPYQSLKCEKKGTDQMFLRRVKVYSEKCLNIPTLNHQPIKPEKYEQVITNAFVKCYKFILKNRIKLLSDHSPLNVFKNATVRVVFRDTNIYKKILIESFHPSLLNNYKNFYEHFAWMKNISNFADTKICLNSELTDLHNNNIPYFYCVADQACIYDSQKKKLDLNLLSSALHKVKLHLATHFGREDMRFQRKLIANSFTALRMNKSLAKKISDKKKILEKDPITHEGNLLYATIKKVGINTWMASILKIENE